MMFHYLSFRIHGGADHDHGGVAETVAALLTFLESLTTKTPQEIFSSFFPGIAAMDNFHPMLVHFPIAFLSTFFFLDLAGTLAKKTAWRTIASWLLYFGTVAAALTVLAGFIAADTVEHGDNVHTIMETHEYYGIAVLILSLVLSLWRMLSKGIIRGAANTLFLTLTAFLLVILSLGADLGGMMVYQYGVGVESVPAQTEVEGHVHTH